MEILYVSKDEMSIVTWLFNPQESRKVFVVAEKLNHYKAWGWDNLCNIRFVNWEEVINK